MNATAAPKFAWMRLPSGVVDDEDDKQARIRDHCCNHSAELRQNERAGIEG